MSCPGVEKITDSGPAEAEVRELCPGGKAGSFWKELRGGTVCCDGKDGILCSGVRAVFSLTVCSAVKDDWPHMLH